MTVLAKGKQIVKVSKIEKKKTVLKNGMPTVQKMYDILG